MDLLKFKMYGNEISGEAPEGAWDMAIAAFPCSSDVIVVGSDALGEAPEEAWDLAIFFFLR